MSEEVQESEVSSKATRRRFTAVYKREVLRQAEGCTQRGEMGALLRREGLYSSHLTAWRAELSRSDLVSLSPKKRGPKGRPRDARDQRIAELERSNARLQKRIEHAELIIDVQKKVSALLGISLPSSDENP
jgi:transposase